MWKTEFGQLEIPCFLDRTRGIVLNPMIEYIKSALQLYIKDFSYDTVFHFLRSGMADISREEIDELENYVIRTGARGYRTYSRLFTRRTEELQRGNAEGSEQAEEKTMERLNRIRQQFMDAVEILHGKPGKGWRLCQPSVRFPGTEHQVQQKLLNYQQQFEKRETYPEPESMHRFTGWSWICWIRSMNCWGRGRNLQTGICGYFRGRFRRDHCRYDPSERGSYRGGRYGANPSETGEGIVFPGSQ